MGDQSKISGDDKVKALKPKPLVVVVTGAAGQIAYSLLPLIANGTVFGQRKLELRLLDIPRMMDVAQGVKMELEDCGFPLVENVVVTDNLQVAFKMADAVFLVGSMPRVQGMERSDLLAANVKIFMDQGKALREYANPDVKVLVVGNPANTNAMVCARFAQTIPQANFTALTRLDQNRATALLAKKVGLSPDGVSNVIIWGNHSSTQFPDASQARFAGYGRIADVAHLVPPNYLQNEFTNLVRGRGAAVIAARQMSSAMSAAKAAADHMRDWWNGTPEGKFTSMAVMSDGSYGIERGIVYSFPVICRNKQWEIVQNMELSTFALEQIKASEAELIAEKRAAADILEPQGDQ